MQKREVLKHGRVLEMFLCWSFFLLVRQKRVCEGPEECFTRELLPELLKLLQ